MRYRIEPSAVRDFGIFIGRLLSGRKDLCSPFLSQVNTRLLEILYAYRNQELADWSLSHTGSAGASGLELIHVNDMGDAETHAHLLAFDSVHGHSFVSAERDRLVINGNQSNLSEGP